MFVFWHWNHLPTEHPCPVCEHPLNRVIPSSMVVCDNPACTQEDPLYLIPQEES